MSISIVALKTFPLYIKYILILINMTVIVSNTQVYSHYMLPLYINILIVYYIYTFISLISK